MIRLLALLALLSCGTTPSESSFCQDSSRLECEASQACGGDLFGSPDLDTCIADLRMSCSYFSDRCELQASADACLTALDRKRSTCSPSGQVEECVGLWTGCPVE